MANERVLFVVPTEPLVWQVAAMFEKLLAGSGQVALATNQLAYRPSEDKSRVVVGTPLALESALVKVRGRVGDEVTKRWDYAQLEGGFEFDYAVFDEVHALDGDEGAALQRLVRSVACPTLALSATIGNADQLRDWWQTVRDDAAVDGAKDEVLLVEHSGRFINVQNAVLDATGTKLQPLHPAAALTVKQLVGVGADKVSFALTPADAIALFEALKLGFGDAVHELEPSKWFPALSDAEERDRLNAVAERSVKSGRPAAAAVTSGAAFECQRSVRRRVTLDNAKAYESALKLKLEALAASAPAKVDELIAKFLPAHLKAAEVSIRRRPSLFEEFSLRFVGFDTRRSRRDTMVVWRRVTIYYREVFYDDAHCLLCALFQESRRTEGPLVETCSTGRGRRPVRLATLFHARGRVRVPRQGALPRFGLPPRLLQVPRVVQAVVDRAGARAGRQVPRVGFAERRLNRRGISNLGLGQTGVETGLEFRVTFRTCSRMTKGHRCRVVGRVDRSNRRPHTWPLRGDSRGNELDDRTQARSCGSRRSRRRRSSWRRRRPRSATPKRPKRRRARASETRARPTSFAASPWKVLRVLGGGLRMGEDDVWVRTTESVLKSHVTCASRWKLFSNVRIYIETGNVHRRYESRRRQVDVSAPHPEFILSPPTARLSSKEIDDILEELKKDKEQLAPGHILVRALSPTRRPILVSRVLYVLEKSG